MNYNTLTFGPHPAVLSGYSTMHSRITPMMLGGTIWDNGDQTPTAYNRNILSTILSLYSLKKRVWSQSGGAGSRVFALHVLN